MDKRDGRRKKWDWGVNLMFNKWGRGDGKGPWDAHDEDRSLSRKDRRKTYCAPLFSMMDVITLILYSKRISGIHKFVNNNNRCKKPMSPCLSTWEQAVWLSALGSRCQCGFMFPSKLEYSITIDFLFQF